MLRTDVPLFQILSFQAFDRGEDVSQHIEGEFEFSKGDTVEWEAGCNNSGYALVVSAIKPARNGYTYVTLNKNTNSASPTVLKKDSSRTKQ